MLLARVAIVLAGLLLGLAPAAAIDPGMPNPGPPIDPQQVIGGQNAIDRGYQYQVRPVSPGPSPAVQPQWPPAPVINYGGSGRPIVRGSARARRAAGRSARPRARATLPQSSIMAPETTPRRAKTRR